MTRRRTVGRSVVRRGTRAAVAALVLTACGVTGALAGSVLPPAPTRSLVASATACVVSPPLMGLAPYPGTRIDFLPPFVNLTATNGRGTYAGVSFTNTSVGPSFTVVRRDPGGAVRVLGRFVYTSVYFPARSVRVVGIDPWGGVVVRVQRTDAASFERSIGIRYDAAGVRHDLTREPSWLSVEPIAVADSGSVVGTVTGPDRKQRVVIWRGQGSGAMTRLSAPGRQATAFAANGDWYDDSQTGYSAAQVHPHGNAPARRLLDLGGEVSSNHPRLQGTSYDQALGVDNDATAITIGTMGWAGVGARWAPGSTSGSTTPVPADRAFPFYGIAGVGRSGDAVGVIDPKSGGDTRGPLVFASRTGRLAALPAAYVPLEESLPVVVDPSGHVVLTSAARLPVMVTCPQ